MTDVVPELRHHEREYASLVHGPLCGNAADEIQRLRAALTEAERFMAYFANETNGHFVGPGTPTSCLVQIRAALPPAERPDVEKRGEDQS